MVSAIVLARKYLTVPVFCHYFMPAFENVRITVEDKHGFRENLEDKIIFSLRGEMSIEKIYEIMGNVIPTIEEDNKTYASKWEMNSNSIPEWRMAYPTLIDRKPKIIGMYKDDKTATKLFCATALEYIAHASDQKIDEVVNDLRSKLQDLGAVLSEI